MAIYSRKMEAAEFLVKNGADVRVKDRKGKTALALLESLKDSKYKEPVLRMLEETNKY